MLTQLNTIGTLQEFKDARFFFIADSEGVKTEIYLDTKGIPSNGIGFNLASVGILNEVVTAFGFNLTVTADIQARDDLLALFQTAGKTAAQYQAGSYARKLCMT